MLFEFEKNNAELAKKISELEEQVRQLEEKANLKIESDPNKKDDFEQLARSQVPESLWESYFYNSAFFPFTLTVNSSASTFRERYQESSKKVFSLTRRAKFRATFFIGGTGGVNDVTFYLLGFQSRKEIALSSTDPVLSNNAQYAGLKIINGKMFLAAAGNSGPGNSNETLIDINKNVATLETVFFEMDFYPRERVDYYINGDFVGTISRGIPSQDLDLYYPLWASGIRTGGSNTHVMNVEFFEFTQIR